MKYPFNLLIAILLVFTTTPLFAQTYPEMVKVQGGLFTMGSISEQEAIVSTFSIGKYPITVAQYRAFCKDTGRSMPDSRELDFDADGDLTYVERKWINSEPIRNVDRLDAVAYTEWLSKKTGRNYRLPTSYEWEYAARGGNKSKGYIYSGSNDLNQVGWFEGNRPNLQKSVGSKKPNELGLYDMSGYVWEWSENGYKHGGAYFHSAENCTVTSVTKSSITERNHYDTGFRVVQSVAKPLKYSRIVSVEKDIVVTTLTGDGLIGNKFYEYGRSAKHGMYGAATIDGIEILPPKYDLIHVTNEGNILTVLEDHILLYSSMGNRIPISKEKAIEEFSDASLQFYNSEDSYVVAEALPFALFGVKNGNAKAFYVLGKIYECGCSYVVKKDLEESMNWFIRSADLGHYESIITVATNYANGNGIEPNFAKSIDYFEKALEHTSIDNVQGHKSYVYKAISTIYSLGGYGLVKDEGKSKEFLALAEGSF